MGLQPTEFEVDGETYEAVVDTETPDPDHGVVVLPGAGHGPTGDIFDIIAYELARAGQTVLRYASWDDDDEPESRTLADLQHGFDGAVERLRAEGCSTVTVFGKSFGGGLALSYVPDAVERLVLWAPAVEFADEATGPADRVGDGHFPLRVTEDQLRRLDVPVRVLCGTEDSLLPEARRVAGTVPDGELIEVPGEDHSFMNERSTVVDHTIDFVTDD